MIKRKLLRAAIYCRVSTQKYSQDESIESQQVDGRKAAEELGCTEVKVFVDRKSGTTVGRKGYQQMFTMMEQGLFDVIVVKDLDRLNRNTLDWYLFLKEAQTHDVKIYFYLQRKFYDVTDKIIVGVKALLAEEYSNNLSLKSNDAHRRRQAQGGSAIFTNNVWGYKTIFNEDGTKKLVVDEEEATMVRLIFQYIIEGKGVHLISKELYTLGYKNHNGNVIGRSVILAIVRNPKVTGDIIVNKTHYNFETKKTIKNPQNEWIYLENIVPAIIDRDTFNKANELLDKRAARYENGHRGGIYKGKYELSKKIICGDCGASYRRSTRKTENGMVYDWFCSTYSNLGRKTVNKYKIKTSNKVGNIDGCDNIRIKENIIVEILGKIAHDYFSGSPEKNIISKALDLLKKALENLTDDMNIDTEKDDIKKQLNDIVKKENLLLEKLLDEVITDVLYKLKQEQLTNQKEELESRLSELENTSIDREQINKRMMTIQRELENGGMKKITIDILLTYIKQITVYADRLDIEISLSRMTNIYLDDFMENDVIVISEPLDKYKLAYCESGINKTREMVLNAIKENTKIHIDEIVKVTGLSKSMVNSRIKALKNEGIIKSFGARETFRWEVLCDSGIGAA